MAGSLFFCFFVCLFIAGINGYSVSGNKILDSAGNEVLLRGIDRPSLEWSRTGEGLSQADYCLMKGWGANVVRVSLNQDWYLEDASYVATVKQQAVWIKACGMGVIYDLHWNKGGQQKMADQDSKTFWRNMANDFKNDPLVAFELYNEPHDLFSWDVWRNGNGNFAGMQELYDAVRSTGANNMVIVNGDNWAFDLSGVRNGYAITGTNIAYGSHPYNYGGKLQGDWDNAFGLLAATAPVILTEFGQYCADDGYVAALLAYAQAKKIHWTGWAWYPGGCGFPALITDWSGTPTPIAGTLVKQYLGGGVVPPSSSSSTTGGSTSGPAPTVPPATGALDVYVNSLVNGFQDWSWSKAKSLSDSQYTRSAPSSIKFAVQAFEAIYFHRDSFFSLGSYDRVQFYAFSPTYISAGSLGVLLYGTSANTQIGNGVNFPSDLQANTWTAISIPLSSFGASTAQVNGIAIQAKTTDNVGTVWIDDISFVPVQSSTTGGSTPAPTAKPTSVPTAKPTTAPTPKPTPATAAPTTSPTAKPTSAATAPPTKTPTTKPTTPTLSPTTPPATSSPTTKPTTRPTTSPTNSPATLPPTAKATPRPTSNPTTTPATQAPSSSPTSAPTQVPTRSPTSPPSGECNAANIVITQTAINSWPAGSDMITHYAVSVTSTCTTKTLVGLVVRTTPDWVSSNFWGVAASGNDLTFPSYMQITPASPFNNFGYQSKYQNTFTVLSYSFQ